MKRNVAAQLLALRRRHEQRALEALAKSEAALKTARKAANEAREETLHYVAEARVQEGELIAELTGKPAGRAEIGRLQSIRADMSVTAGKLQAAESRASSHAQQAQQEVAKAQEAARLRQKAVLKLETFVKKERLRTERKRAELADEEQMPQGKTRQNRGISQ
jgi:hypothetical protein